MNTDKKNYYKEHLEEYIKEVFGYELFPWQSHLLKKYIENPDVQWVANIGRTSGKRMFFQALDKVKEELLEEKNEVNKESN